MSTRREGQTKDSKDTKTEEVYMGDVVFQVDAIEVFSLFVDWRECRRHESRKKKMRHVKIGERYLYSPHRPQQLILHGDRDITDITAVYDA